MTTPWDRPAPWHAGAGTIYRNYLVPLEGECGQTAQRQINTLAELGAALGHEQEPLWKWMNGYALCHPEGLARVNQQLAAASEAELNHLRGLLRIELHWDGGSHRRSARPGAAGDADLLLGAAGGLWPSATPRLEAAGATGAEAVYEATMLAGTVPRAACC